jgi:alpha-galactosidase
MSYKIAMIGAGSVVFSRNLTGDLLQYEPFHDATFTYMDIDAERLDVGAKLSEKAARALGTNAKIEQTMDRREAVKDADFVVCMVQIGGFNSTLVDFEIPRKYGLNFTIADTTGPGGLFRALRTYPLMRDLARDISDVARPDCWLLNYSNPMSMNMKSLFHTSGERATGRGGINAVGLCHSVQGTFAGRMRDLELEEKDATFEVSGINHMAFFTKLQHKDGRDLYPALFELADDAIAKGNNPVRYELMKRLGYFITESSEHNAEYCAHFMPHEGYIDRYDVPVDEYLRRCDGIVDEFDRLVEFARSDEPMDRDKIKKSHEYGSVIANSIAANEPAVVYGNMLNDGAIPNLPATSIVETPTLVDGNGCRLTRVDPMPYQLLNYVMPHVCQHELFLEAAMEGRRDRVYQAAMADPLTAATVPLDKIVEMCDELIAAHGLEKDGGVLPDLDATPSRVPTSGKTYHPPTPEDLRASWEEAKKATSDEEVLPAWQVRQVDADADAAAVSPNGDASTWQDVQTGEDDHVILKPEDDKAAVAYAVLDSVHDREAPIRVTATRWRPVTVWVNGEQAFNGDDGEASIQLKQGKNEIAIRAEQQTSVAFYVRKPNF